MKKLKPKNYKINQVKIQIFLTIKKLIKKIKAN